MTDLEFASVTIGQLAWPVIVVVLVLIMRGPLKTLFETSEVKSVKAGTNGFEIEFERKLTEVEHEFGGVLHSRPGTKADAVASENFREDMAAVVAFSPRAAVLESYARLEQQLQETFLPTEQQQPVTGRELTHLAVEEGLLEFEEAMIFRELTTLRNSIAHNSEATITRSAASRYVELAAETADAIRANHYLQTGGGSVLPPPES
ncbi:hypothetical protein ACFO6V_23880 [Promicromonospora alba]|uniref:DUF4145 domain-containing protein n=1 Tax=Promicromonospora alba TaxID=1616110 RepID=A0ABV9HQ33_9MICO